jgi:hypothetical protein
MNEVTVETYKYTVKFVRKREVVDSTTHVVQSTQPLSQEEVMRLVEHHFEDHLYNDRWMKIESEKDLAFTTEIVHTAKLTEIHREEEL